MTAAQPPTSPGLPGLAPVVPLIPAARSRPPLQPRDFLGVAVGDPEDGSGRPVAALLEVYAGQVDEIAAVVEQWQATPLDRDTHRRYAAAVLGALGELHVALDTAAELVTQSPAHPASAVNSRRHRAGGPGGRRPAVRSSTRTPHDGS